MKPKKPSEEYLDFLRKYKEEEEIFLIENCLYSKYNTMQEYLEDKIKQHIQYYIDAGLEPVEIKEFFKGISLFNKINLNL
jgi:hypothetical protein